MREEYERLLTATGWVVPFKDMLFIEAAFQGRFSVDFDLGLIRNNYTGKIYQTKHVSGYLQIGLKYRDKSWKIMVHRLIWMLACGPIPPGLFINHMNGIKTDNRLKNLELVTNAENCRHAIELGLSHPGNSGPALRKYFDTHPSVCSRLTADQIKEIFRLRKEDPKTYTVRKLGAMFNVNHPTIVKILQGKKYRFYNSVNLSKELTKQ